MPEQSPLQKRMREAANAVFESRPFDHTKGADAAYAEVEPLIIELVEAMRWGIDADERRYFAAMTEAKRALGWETLAPSPSGQRITPPEPEQNGSRSADQ